MLPELSPANGALTPGAAGFLETDFASGRELESSMMQFRNGPEADETKTPSNTPESAPAGTSQCRQYIRLSGRTELCWLTEYELSAASVVVICVWISDHSAISSGVAAVAVCSPSTAENVIGEGASEGASIAGIGSSLCIDGNLP